MANKPPKQGAVTARDIRQAIESPGVAALSAYSVPRVECPVRLDGNESPFAPPRELARKVTEATSAAELNRYPDPHASRLRALISGLYDVPVGSVLLGNGSDELITMLLMAFSGGSGAVLCPVPTFSMYALLARALGLTVIEVPLDEGFDLPLHAVLGHIAASAPDIVFLATPNNPTGNCFSEDRVEAVIGASRGVVVVDEAYCDYSGTSFIPLLPERENLVVLRTMSKVGFAALRLGMLFAAPELTEELNKVRLPYNINSLSMAAAEVVLREPAFMAENARLIIRERGRVYGTLRAMDGVEPHESDANFILIRVGDAGAVFARLVESGVLVRNLSSPGRLMDCLRVTIGTPGENDAFLSALAAALAPE